MSVGHPSFFCIGAQKAGTTWLYGNLRVHPEVYLPPYKELHYLDQHLDSGYENGRRIRHFLLNFIQQYEAGSLDLDELQWFSKFALEKQHDDTWYASLFEAAGPRVSGDITPSYGLLSTEDVRSVHQRFPQAKIIYLMRNPLGRVLSNFRMSLNNGFCQQTKEALHELIESERCRGQTNYIEVLERWESVFGKDRVLPLFFDELTQAPHRLLQRVCRFLDIAYAPQIFKHTAEVLMNGSGGMPEASLESRQMIAECYLPSVIRLAERFRHPVMRWQRELESLLADAPSSL